LTQFSTDSPRWLKNKYDLLWNEFGEQPFTFEEATHVFEKNQDNKKDVPVFLSKLRKSGSLTVEMDPLDARRRIYSLKSQQEMINDLLTLSKNKIGRGDIERLLKKAADLIRTRVDYKFILVLLFFKRVSDKWRVEFEAAYEDAKEDGLSDADASKEARNSSYHDFDLPEEFLWDNIRKDVTRLPENFSKAMKTLVKLNPELSDILDNIDFVQFTSSRENAEILRQLVDLFSEKKLHNVSPDILGDAYEWILKFFAPDKAKEGEVYTPREVIDLLVKILDPKPGDSVYDPASASNGMLILSYKHVQKKYGNEVERLFMYGQEANQRTLALGRMNLFIHDIKNAKIAYGDTLLFPKFKSEKDEVIKTFNVVIANPPWNQDGYGEEVLKKGEFWKQRFTYGFTPSQSADWAWIQHMVSSAKNDSGRVGVIVDSGCIFRGGKEGSIRSKFLDDDVDKIECVILLPEKLFYNTGAPGIILILKNSKPLDRKGKVLFINASNEYEQHPELRKLNRLGDEHIQKIVDAYNSFKDILGFCNVIPLDQIRENGGNLGVTRYVSTEEKEFDIDIKNTWIELKKLESKREDVKEKIAEYLKVLGYEK
jgi:type I restriction enzyme M protein